MIPMKIKYYSFQEVLDVYPLVAPSYPHDKDMTATWFTNILTASDMKVNYYGLDASFTDSIKADILNMLMTIVYNRHYNDSFYEVGLMCSETHTLNYLDFRKAFNKLINVIELTFPRYAPIFIQNRIHSGNPIDKISSTSRARTRFNDTPQEEGEYNDEEHATNVSATLSESQVDSGSIMERLEAMFKGFRSIILEWSNEFNRLFIEEELIYE